MSSRSRELRDPSSPDSKSRTWANSRMGFAVSLRKAKAAPMPGISGESLMWGMLPRDQLGSWWVLYVGEVGSDVAVASDHLAALSIEGGVLRLHGGEAVAIGVVHAKGS